MSRYRPPSAPSSPHITAQGFQALKQELDDLWSRRREVVVHLSAAAAEGDRSENAEYIYRKKQLRELDRRIGYLQRRIPILTVVSAAPAQHQKVFFGAHVTLIDEHDNEVCYRIVGADEIDPKAGWISIDSPVARALLGREIDDEVSIATPGGQAHYWVAAIRYAV